MSSETKATHTPGPWIVDSERTGIIAIRNGKREHIAESFFFATGFEAMANARLIAAAPDLLEEMRNAAANLETILDLIDGYVDVKDGDYGVPTPNNAMRAKHAAEHSLNALERAIAKAEGRP